MLSLQHMDPSSDENSSREEDDNERQQIREELSSMSFEEILKLKDELGAKLYKEAVLGKDNGESRRNSKDSKSEFKRLNKNRPREMSSKKQVPFLSSEPHKKKGEEINNRDPRFDEKCGTYSTSKFKEDYKFLGNIRRKEVNQLKKEIAKAEDDADRKELKQKMQRLVNKNVEDRKWHLKQTVLKNEQKDIQKAQAEGRQPHFVTKKERRAKELVAQFEELKKTGKLSKHLEKRRKKNAAKDRKKFSFD